MSDRQDFILRDARADELDTVAEIIRAAYAQYAPEMAGGRFERYIQHATDVRSRLDEAELIVAEVGSQPVGAVTFYPDGTQRGAGGWPPGWAAIRLLGVHPDARGLGIGRALVQECIDRARALGAPAVGLHTTEMMAVARAMYERMGFVRVPEQDFRTGAGREVPAYRFALTGP